MSNYLKVDTNEVENGYIYKHLNNRMNILETNFKEINNLLKNININDNTIDFRELLKKIELKVDRSALEYHINDDRLHVSGEMKTFMESNNFVPRKFSKIYQPSTNNVDVIHNLKSDEITISILDMSTHLYIQREIELLNLNSIKIKFLSSDLNKNFKITIIS